MWFWGSFVKNKTHQHDDVSLNGRINRGGELLTEPNLKV